MNQNNDMKEVKRRLDSSQAIKQLSDTLMGLVPWPDLERDEAWEVATRLQCLARRISHNAGSPNPQ